MSFSRSQSDGLMVVSGDFTLFTPKTVLSPESIQILTRYMSENLPANTADTQNVIFHGVHEKNSPKEKLSCCFKFTDESKIQPGDIVAICPQGWKHFREIVSYVPAEIHFFDKWISMYIVSFEADNLPKDCTKYEFCYISSGNILGTSKPFTFFSTSESDLSIISEGDYIAVEDPFDPGLVVFKSRGSKSTEDFSKELELSAKFENFHVEEENYSVPRGIQLDELDLSTKLENLHVEEENSSEQQELQHENSVSQSVNEVSPAKTNKNETQEIHQIKEMSLGKSASEDKTENTPMENSTSDLAKDNVSQFENSESPAETNEYETQEKEQTKVVNKEPHNVNGNPEIIDKISMIESLLKSNKSSASTSTTSSIPQSTSNCSFEMVNNEPHNANGNPEILDKIPMIESLLKQLLQSNKSSASTSTTSSIPQSTSYCSSEVINANSSLSELIHKLSNFSPNLQLKPEGTPSKNTFGAREVEDDCGYDGQQLESKGEMNCSVGNSSIKTSILSDPPTNSLQQEPVCATIQKMESTTEIKCAKSVLPSTSSSSLETNNCICSASGITAVENKELQERIRELIETNAFLKSRVSVLELELRTLNEDKYGILLKCVESYENENSFLKDELKRCAKFENEMDSLKFKYEKVIEENSDLRMFVANFAPPFSSGDSKALILENNKLKVKCEQLEHKITNLEYAIQEEKAAQDLKSTRSVRQVILNQGHELAFMRSECREISEKLKTLIEMFESMNDKTEDYLTVTSSLSELQEKCALVIQRDQVKSKLYETISEDHEEKQKLLAQIESLRKEISDVQKQNLKLKEQLISLRKQSVGKVSLQLFRN